MRCLLCANSFQMACAVPPIGVVVISMPLYFSRCKNCCAHICVFVEHTNIHHYFIYFTVFCVIIKTGKFSRLLFERCFHVTAPSAAVRTEVARSKSAMPPWVPVYDRELEEVARRHNNPVSAWSANDETACALGIFIECPVPLSTTQI